MTRSNLNPFVSVSSSLRCIVQATYIQRCSSSKHLWKWFNLYTQNRAKEEVPNRAQQSKHASRNRCHPLRRAMRRDREFARTSTCMSYRSTVDAAALRWEQPAAYSISRRLRRRPRVLHPVAASLRGRTAAPSPPPRPRGLRPLHRPPCSLTSCSRSHFPHSNTFPPRVDLLRPRTSLLLSRTLAASRRTPYRRTDT